MTGFHLPRDIPDNHVMNDTVHCRDSAMLPCNGPCAVRETVVDFVLRPVS